MTRFEPEKARLVVPAAAHAATPHAREPMTEAMPEPINMPCKNARVDSRAEAAANSRSR